MAWTGGLLVADDRPAEWPIAIFEKAFEGLTFAELADAVAATGADGVEATIRPGGHVEPEEAVEQLPRMVEALRSRGKRVIIAATDIHSVDQPHAETLLNTLKQNGVDHYRLGYYHLDLEKPVRPQLAQASARVRELAALNAEIGIQGLYQNHAGGGRRAYVGSLGWDAAMLVQDVPPQHVALAIDTRHLRRDTGSSWRTALAICKPHLGAIYVKDGRWVGERNERYDDVPLGTGAVTKDTFDAIQKGLPPVPICLHVEWIGYRRFEQHEMSTAIEAHRRDVRTLRAWLAA